jgi:hypothetical protein
MTIIEDENYSLGLQFQSIKNARRSNVGETVDGNKKKKMQSSVASLDLLKTMLWSTFETISRFRRTPGVTSEAE